LTDDRRCRIVLPVSDQIGELPMVCRDLDRDVRVCAQELVQSGHQPVRGNPGQAGDGQFADNFARAYHTGLRDLCRRAPDPRRLVYRSVPDAAERPRLSGNASADENLTPRLNFLSGSWRAATAAAQWHDRHHEHLPQHGSLFRGRDYLFCHELRGWSCILDTG
jgi:hypothetical protein